MCTGRNLLFCTFYLIISPILTSILATNLCPHYSYSNYLDDQQVEISGKITDSNSLPIAGVHVVLKSFKQGVISKLDGSYEIGANPNDTLIFTAIGFVSQTVPINHRTTINVQLLEDITFLEGVEVNAGYYTVKEKERTGNISSVKQVDIEKQPISNPLAALQGRMAGVEIIQTSGVPGSGFEIKIRGQNSIRTGANDPLYIIDGVPYSSNSLGDLQTSGSIIPGNPFSPLNNINPSDIESIEILKDADATAIYGSRGANGVVLITTKKGKVGSTKFELNISSSIGKVAKNIGVLNTDEYIAMRKEAYANDGVTTYPFNAYAINDTWDQNRQTNWQNALIGNTAYITNIQSSLSGGSEQTQFLLSGNYNKQTTVFPGDYANKKASAHMRLHHKSKNEKLAVQFSVNFTSTNNNLLSIDLTREALSLAPNAPELYGDDGTLNWENSTWNNPLRQLEGSYQGEGSSLISNARISYKLLKTLSLTTNLGYTQSRLKELRTVPSTTYNPAYGLGSEVSSAIHNNSSQKSWIIEPQLHWKYQLGKTKIAALVGLTFEEQNGDRLSQFANGFTSNSLIENIAAASNLYILGNLLTQYRYHAFFSRINFNHRGKYILNFTGRRDGSSRFGTHKKFSNFGAIGAAWIFSNENFIRNHIPVLSFGKLRASYGTSGNDQIGDYQYLDTYSFGSSKYQNINGLRPTRLFNPNFSWEENKKLEIGLELGFINDRISLSSSFYRNQSSNQLVGIPLPGTTGFSSLNANLDATVENSGLEFELYTLNIAHNNFKWSTGINLSIQKNKLLEFPNLEGSTYANQLLVGEPLNILQVYQSTGVNPQTGYYEFSDINGDNAITSPEDNKVVIDLNPEYFGGINNSLSIGNLQFDFLFQFTKQLGKSYIATNGVIGGASNQPKAVLDRWQNPGDETSIQRFTSGLDPQGRLAAINHAKSDAAIIDASYIRLKNVSLSYQLSNITSKGIGCKLFLRGQNLLTITSYDGLDPENRSSCTIPPLRFITLGTQLTF